MKFCLPHEYLPIEKQLIEEYNLRYLSMKERQLIYFHNDLQEKATIVLAYRKDKARWTDEENRFAQEKRRLN